MSAAKLGKPKTPEHRENIRRAAYRREARRHVLAEMAIKSTVGDDEARKPNGDGTDERAD
jgi:hypothetical protein